MSAMSTSAPTGLSAARAPRRSRPGRRIEDHGLARREPARHFDLIDAIRPERRRCAASPCSPVTTHTAACPPCSVTARFGIRTTGTAARRPVLPAAARPASPARLLERDARAHLRLHVGVRAQNADAHFDDGLGPIGRRKDLAQRALIFPILDRPAP